MVRTIGKKISLNIFKGICKTFPTSAVVIKFATSFWVYQKLHMKVAAATAKGEYSRYGIMQESVVRGCHFTAPSLRKEAAHESFGLAVNTSVWLARHWQGKKT